MKRLTCAATAISLLCAAQTARAELWYVHTEANNIQCEMGDDPQFQSMMCSLTERDGPLAQPKPADCALLWGHSYYLAETGPVQMLCLQKWTEDWPGNVRFEPGASGGGDGISCAATRDTLECSNRDGHGFFLSRGEQRVF